MTNQIITIQGLSTLFGCYGTEVLLGSEYIKALPRARKQQRKYEVLKPLPGKEEFIELRNKYCTVGLSDIVTGAFSDLATLGEELRAWYDTMPENFQNGDKGSQLDEGANTLESFQEPDCPEFAAGMPVCYLPYLEAMSRSARCGDACEALGAAVSAMDKAIDTKNFMKDGLRHVLLDEQAIELEAFRDECEQAIDEAQGVEFPGMYS